MTNTDTRPALTTAESFRVVPVLLALSGNEVPAFGRDQDVLRTLRRVGWLDAVDHGPGAGVHVCLTVAGLEARSAVLCAAAIAADEWVARLPL